MAKGARPSPLRIAVALQTWSRLADAATEGILRYARRYGAYQLLDVLYNTDDEIAPQVRRARPDGVLTSWNLAVYHKVVAGLPPGVPIRTSRPSKSTASASATRP